jgi:DNA-binding LacI/PurR family transcriptional regulator
MDETGPTSKPLSVIEIARLANTSKSTVSRVLRNQPRVAPETRKRVQEIIKAHGFRPNVMARGLTGARTGMIAILCRWMESDFASEVIRGADVEVQNRGDHLLSSFSHATEGYIDLWLNFVAGGQVDGVILVAPPLEMFSQPIKPAYKPIVLCAAQPADGRPVWDQIDRVMLENERGMERAVNHLVERGCRRLAHFEGPPNNFDSAQRRQAFAAATARAAGVASRIVEGAFNEEMAYWRTLEVLKEGPGTVDGIVTFNDGMALGVLRALRESGVRVPHDIAVVGWDDSRFASFAELTTVRVPMAELGRQAATLLYHQINTRRINEHGSRLFIDTTLAVRRSSSR